MKIPSLQTTEGVLLLGAVAFAAYVAYKSYQTGAGIAAGVKKTFTDIFDAGTQAVDSVKVLTSQSAQDGTQPYANESDQSGAETDRLLRQAGAPTVADNLASSTATTNAAAGIDPSSEWPLPGLGEDTSIYATPQIYSPSAVGSW